MLSQSMEMALVVLQNAAQAYAIIYAKWQRVGFALTAAGFRGF